MKKLPVLIFISILLYSCKKDKDSGSSGSGPLLYLRTDSNFANGVLFGVDTTRYTYDENGRLKSSIAHYLLTDVESEADTFLYDRDAKGRTTTLTRKERRVENNVAQPVFTFVSQVTYEPGSDRIQYLRYHEFGDNFDAVDSVAYDYTNGSLTGTRVFTSGNPTQVFYSNSFTFNNNGDLTACSLNIGPYTAQVDYVINYDGKTNPVKRGLEEVAAPGLTSKSNMISETMHRSSGDTKFSVTFTYRKDGRPLTAIYPADPGAIVVSHTNYYYQ